MGEQIIAYGKEYFYVVFILVGALIVLGCIRNWSWATSILSPSTLPGLRGFIEGLHGVEARHRFERWVNLICGVVLIITGVVYWLFLLIR